MELIALQTECTDLLCVDMHDRHFTCGVMAVFIMSANVQLTRKPQLQL